MLKHSKSGGLDAFRKHGRDNRLLLNVFEFRIIEKHVDNDRHKLKFGILRLRAGCFKCKKPSDTAGYCAGPNTTRAGWDESA